MPHSPDATAPAAGPGPPRPSAADLSEPVDRFRWLFENTSEAVWRFEVDRPIAIDLPVDEQVDLCFRLAYLAECNSSTAAMYGYASPADLVGVRLTALMPPGLPENVEYLRAFVLNGYRIADVESVEVAVDGSPRHVVNSLIAEVADGHVVRAWGTSRDVTDRKRVEAELRQSRAMLRTVLDTIPLGVFWKDRDHVFLGMNATAARAAGFARQEDVIGLCDHDLPGVTPEQAEAFRRNDREVIESGRPRYDILEPIRRADGSTTWLNTHKIPLFDADGRVAGVLGTAEDVTERLRAEQALRIGEERLRLAHEATGLGLFDYDPRTRRQVWSERARAICGFSADEPVTPERLLSIVHPDDRERLRLATVGSLDPGGPGEFAIEHRIVRGDGGVRWVAAHGRTSFEGQGSERRAVRLLGTVLDVTDRREAEEALHASRTMLRTVLDNIPLGVFWKDRSSVYVGTNNVAARAAGFASPSAAIGLTDFALPGLPPEQAEAFRRVDQEVMTSGRPVRGMIEPMRRPDGSTSWLSTHKVPLRDAAGAVVGILGTWEDVTERLGRERTAQFLAGLNETTLGLTDPGEVMATTVRGLGEHLGADRCAYLEFDENGDDFTVAGEHCRGVPAVTGRHRLADFGTEAARALRANEPLLVEDAASDPRVAGASDAFRDAGAAAFVCVPLHRQGRLAAAMAVQQAAARRWSRDEVELVGLVANRCWEAIERARVSRRLAAVNADLARRVDELQTLLDVIPVGIGIAYDPDCRDIRVNPAFARMLRLERGRNASKSAAEAERPTHFRILDEEGRERPADQLPMQRVAREGCEIRDLEIDVAFDDGRTLRMLESVVPLFDEEGRPRGAVGAFVDITERQRAEVALRESESRFRDMADHAPVMIWVTEPDGRCSFLGKTWYEFTGQTPATGLGLGWTDAVHPDDRAAAEEAFLAANGRRCPLRLEYRLRRRDGEYRWAIDSASPRFDGSGTFLGYIGSVIDITDRKRAEEALRESEAWLRNIADNLPALVSYVDCGLRYRFVNGAYLDWFGQEPDSFLGATIRDVLGEEMYEHRRGYLDAVLRGEAVRFEGPTLHRRLGWRQTEVVYTPDFDGGGAVRGFFVLVHDATERKEAEQRHREAEEQFRTLADNIPQLAWMADPSGWIFWYNRRWYEYTGWSFEQAQGWGWQALLEPAEVDRMLPRWQAAVAAGEPWEDTFTLRRHDGQRRWHLSRAMPVRDADGRIVRWFGTNTDVSEQRELEQALRDADRRKDEFLATLGHELRNPLASIVNAAEAIAAGGPRSAAERGEMAEIVERQARHMSRLIDDLLDVARIARGKILLRSERLDLAEVVRQTAEDHRREVEDAGLSLAVEVPRRPLWVEGDRTRLAQVIGNLLHNAVKFTDVGGGIVVAVANEGGRAAVRVRDTGLGMTPEMLGRIFVPFSQADASLARARGGLGLGLALVRGLVDLHQGRVEASSEGLGRGAEFVVRLPLVAGSDAPGQPEPGTTQTAGRLRVLAIDDRRDILRPLQVLLTRDGHEVEVATSGAAGIEVAVRMRPDAVICDIGLPGEFNGYDVARALRAESALAGTRLIALTGYGQESDRQAALAAGFDLHLTKPVDIRVLRSALSGTMPVPR